MYKVHYSNSKLTSPCDFGECASMEEAVALAMAVHRSSNVPHHVVVTNPDCSHLISFDLVDRRERVREPVSLDPDDRKERVRESK